MAGGGGSSRPPPAAFSKPGRADGGPADRTAKDERGKKETAGGHREKVRIEQRRSQDKLPADAWQSP